MICYNVRHLSHIMYIGIWRPPSRLSGASGRNARFKFCSVYFADAKSMQFHDTRSDSAYDQWPQLPWQRFQSCAVQPDETPSSISEWDWGMYSNPGYLITRLYYIVYPCVPTKHLHSPLHIMQFWKTCPKKHFICVPFHFSFPIL